MNTRREYLRNVLWSWMSAAGLILNGILLSPYLVRRLGTDQFGIWALGLSLVDYFWMIDLGMRPATVKLTAEHRALEQWDLLNQVLSTAATYSSAMGLLILTLISLNTGAIARFYHIANPAFPLLIHAVSLSWAFGLVFNVFEAALEGFQRFDITSRVFIGFMLARTLSLVAMVKLGFGLGGMSAALLITQLMLYGSFLYFLRRVYPGLRISPWRVTKEAGRELWTYARQVVSAMLSGRLLAAAVPSLIALSLGARSVAYYSITQKILDYAGEGIGRIGLITAPRAADWMARGFRPQIIRLASYGNRYCLTLWLVVSTYLFVYGRPLLRIWYTLEVADQAGSLLPFMLTGYTFWLGQFVSASILMGVGRYGEYSFSLMIEGILTVGGFALALPRYGLVGAVAVSSAMILLNRCVNLSRIFAKEFQIAQWPFLWQIYRIPMLLGILDVALLGLVRREWLPGQTLVQLICIGALNAALWAALAFSLVIEPDHRELALDKADEILRRFTGYGLKRIPLGVGPSDV